MTRTLSHLSAQNSELEHRLSLDAKAASLLDQQKIDAVNIRVQRSLDDSKRVLEDKNEADRQERLLGIVNGLKGIEDEKGFADVSAQHGNDAAIEEINSRGRLTGAANELGAILDTSKTSNVVGDGGPFPGLGKPEADATAESVIRRVEALSHTSVDAPSSTPDPGLGLFPYGAAEPDRVKETADGIMVQGGRSAEALANLPWADPPKEQEIDLDPVVRERRLAAKREALCSDSSRMNP